MSDMLLLLYVVAWFVAFILHQKKAYSFGAGSLLIFSYFIFSIFSLIWYNHPDSDYGAIHFFPFLYLFSMLLIGAKPILKFDELKTVSIVRPSSFLLKGFCVVYILSTIAILPSTLPKIGEGLVQLMLDENGGMELYKDAHEATHEATGGISNPFSIVFNIFSDAGTLFCFYYLSLRKRNKWFVIGLIIAALITMLSSLTTGSRTEVIMKFFTVIISYFAFRRFYEKKIKIYISAVGLLLGIGIVFLFMSLTLSRFGNRDDGGTGSMISYAGQAPINFNQYGLNPGGTRHGDRTCGLFKTMLGYRKPNDVQSVRARYGSMKMDDSVFYTYVGDFTLDFGPITTFLLFVFFSFFFQLITKPINKRLFFHQIIALHFVMCVCMQGGMYLFYYSFTQNLTILAYVFLFIVFWIDSLSRIPSKSNLYEY